MKTQIVYVISSNETDVYLEQALLSAYSCRVKNPSAKIVAVMDSRTDATVKGNRAAILKYIDEKIVADVPAKYNKVETSRYMKTTLPKHVTGDFLYVDTDTIITDNLDEIDQFEGELGAVLDIHVPVSQHENNGQSVIRNATKFGWNCNDSVNYYNGGLMYAKDCDTTRRLYAEWNRIWTDNMERERFHYDQHPLAMANERLGYPIKELNGVWNCQILEYGLPYLCNAKVIHYFTNHGEYKYRPTVPYVFYDKAIYKEIRDNGEVTERIKTMVENARNAFVNPTRIVAGRELVLLSGDMANLCLHYPKLLKVMNCLAHPIVRLRFNAAQFRNRILKR